MKIKLNIKKLEKDDEIHQVVALAQTLWFEHYSSIIGEKQVQYMLEKFQTFEAVKKQLNEQYQYFLVIFNKELIGYFSIQYRESSSLFISKFYLSKSMRGQGVGKTMLSHIEDIAAKKLKKTIDLTVNKNNSSYDIYLKLGFVKIKSIQFDIGGGYIMDDYLMSKTIR